MLIRRARPDDFPTLQNIERAAGEMFRDIGMPEIADDDPPDLADLARHHQANTAWVAVTTTDHPVAYLIADPVDGNLHLEQITVHPHHARQGIGRQLIDHAAEAAREANQPALTLTTFRDVPWNAPYYERCGFETLQDHEITPGLRDIQTREAAHGLDRWPRVAMRRQLGQATQED
ncbi:GNAT family N-acetyltransferase [Asanoa siamensis]|uniref:GCN5 family N-acetyltransferase n=1 Tax=Asanoa siamensis TaxID=926357 RepID=A0ABQ4CIN6_9ACTN|nr:GNAT family N-acetyltransferase [Asanoa siamensis]GIF71159.1 GCN5 family N-acetyltransferase [Asanoa siamensis]